jgi:betaine-aldehyde dehydrogenase
MAGHTSFVRREPIGVCAQVTPWNYPLMMAVWKFAPALAAGNTVVLKPSDTTPATTVRMAELAAEILPPGVFNVVCGDRRHRPPARRPPDSAARVDHGSVRGRHAGRRGGVEGPKRPAPRARRQGAGGRSSTTPTSRRPPRRSPTPGYFNAGQDCTAATRVLGRRRGSTTTSPPR